MIRLICVGKVSSKPMQELIKDYSNRISKYSKFEIIELKEVIANDTKTNIDKESEAIMNKLRADIKVYFDVNAKPIKSEWFAETITKARNSSKSIDFVIGGSDGINKELKEKFNHLISFGNTTFPHQLFRVLATEQIYRGLSIINNSKYHK